MSTGNVTKVDLIVKVYKLKTSLDGEDQQDKTGQWHDGAHYSLNIVLDFLNEFAQCFQKIKKKCKMNCKQ